MKPLDALTSNYSPAGGNVQSEVYHPKVFDLTEQKKQIKENKINSNFSNKTF
jgi:hypothetical protein